MKKPELLAPAGNLKKLEIAAMYGADAIYIGGKQFSLRSNASNFSLEDIKNGVAFAKQYNTKIYVVVNIIFHNDDLEGLKEYLQDLESAGVAGIICADLIVIDYIKQYAPSLEIHVSTQQSLTNHQAIKYYENLGVDRVVLAREVSYSELQSIRTNTSLEIEYFVHGAMCVSYSGRCMLSNYYSKRDSNRGGCSQSCRWNYNLLKEDENDKLTNITKEETPFTMSSKDLSLSENLPQLIDLGIDSFKIEGRMKSIYYLATIISSYRKIIDDYLAKKSEFIYNESYSKDLQAAANRSVSTGFFNDDMAYDKQLYQNRQEHPTKEFVGYVLDYNEELQLIKVEQRNYFAIGDKVQIFAPNQDKHDLVVAKMYDRDMNEIDVARHPQEMIYLECEQKIQEHSMIRKVI